MPVAFWASTTFKQFDMNEYAACEGGKASGVLP
jgi:hypothetical protein